MNRGRFQAQGGGLEESEPWSTINDIDKVEANRKIKRLITKISKAELKKRFVAFKKARKFVDDSPSVGHPASVSKTYHNTLMNRSIRVDVEIKKGNAFIDKRDE